MQIDNFCPLTGKCSRVPTIIEENSYFLIEPFDEDKEKRENALKDALKRFYEPMNSPFCLKVGDSKDLHINSLYCDICSKIKSSQYCIVDLTGEDYCIKTKESEFRRKLFIRPNILLELGLAYGLNKPTFVLSRKIDGKRDIPSDIKFVRYLSYNVESDDWSNLTHNFLNVLRDNTLNPEITKYLPQNYRHELFKIVQIYKRLIENGPLIRKTKYSLNQILWDGEHLIGIVNNGNVLVEGMRLNLYYKKKDISVLGGIAVVHYIQDKFAQVILHPLVDDITGDMESIIQECIKNDTYTPGQNHLELSPEHEYLLTNLET
jgi:hypothetical protein